MRSALFAMVSTRDSADYTPHALRSFNESTARRDGDRFILIENSAPFIDDNSLAEFNWEILRNSNPLSFAENANNMIRLALEEDKDLYFLNNDVIFSKDWLTPLRENQSNAILTPICNREVPYINTVTSINTSQIINSFTLLPPPMQLSDYLGRELEFEVIVKTHKNSCDGYLPMMVLPFFCVKIPNEALRTLGSFDESFGAGGGEDFDYCLRANLLEIPVAYSVKSYLLHFGGKSTWEGEEEKLRQAKRQEKYREVFMNKWGQKLFELILNEDASVLEDEKETETIREKITRLCGNKPLPEGFIPPFP